MLLRRTIARALALPVGLLLGACGGSPDGSTGSIEASGSLRLADLLEVAEIESPLLRIPAATGIEALGQVESREVFAEDFEDFDAAAVGWPQSPRGSVVAEDGGRSFLLEGRDAITAPTPGGRALRERRGWVIPAEPNTHYVFERRVRAGQKLAADFEVIEAEREMPLKVLLSGERHTHPTLLRAHWAPEPVPDGEWQRGSVSFHTMPYTRALVVVLWETLRRSAALADDGPGADEQAWFDDLRLTRVEPTPDQSIALVKSKDPEPGAGDALGMRKRGQFLPLHLPFRLGEPQLENYSQRYALYAPPPTTLRFPVTVTKGTALRFSVCLSRESKLGHAAGFAVRVLSGSEEETVWSMSLAAHPIDSSWHDVEVDLSSYAGRSVTLSLETVAEVGHPHPMWGNPVLEAPFQGAGPRNVILIAVDTLRADRLSSYGYEKETSPRLDAFAAEAVRFHNVVSNSTWTSPSFSSIFTGVVPSRHGVWVVAPMMRLPERFETLAERFRSRGWATHSIAFKAPLYAGGFDQGFDVALTVPQQVTRADDNLAKALEWLQASRERRNFLFLHFNDPHQPFSQPEPYVDSFGPVSADLAMPFDVPNGLKGPLRETARHLYDGEVAYVDDRIGAFLDALKSRGLYDDAVIAFVSDHGEELWDHGTFGHGAKFFDETVRVPLIVKPLAGTFEPGRVVETQVRAFDIMPTLLELAELPLTGEMDAESLAPLLAKGAVDQPDRLAVTETNGVGASIRTRRWKYIFESWRRPMPGELLFDIQADPAEERDVSSAHPEVVEGLRMQLFDYIMLSRSGRYVVAIGSGDSTPYELELSGVESAVGMFGLVPTVTADGRARFEGQSVQPLTVVARLNGASSIEAADPSVALRGPQRYRTGDLQRLVDRATPGTYVFDGPRQEAAETNSAQAADLQQLEALRDLGYLGDDE